MKLFDYSVRRRLRVAAMIGAFDGVANKTFSAAFYRLASRRARVGSHTT